VASLRDRLQAQRITHLEPKTHTLPLPGYAGPRVFVRYRPVEWDALLDLLIPQENAGAALDANLQALAKACDAVLIQEDGDEKPVSLAQRMRDEGETVHGEVRFDEYLIDVLALEVEDPEEYVMRKPKNAAETVLAAFSGAVSPPLAVTEQAAELGAWMRSEVAKEDASLLGG
jgi:ssRNA-specific RNase YbeY (16S rRNA maturation enzyme)